MELLNIILDQILSPPILFFTLGMLAMLVGSDLKIPEAMSTAMMIFLLCAIGLEGGIGIAEAGIGAILIPALAAVLLGIGIVLLGYNILLKLKFDIANAGAIAGHYGAVGAATMILGFAYLEEFNVQYETFISALYPLMDSPAVLTAILLTRFQLTKQNGGVQLKVLKMLHDNIFGKAVLIMIACLVIGYVNGTEGTARIMPFFNGMFMGVLCLFMLDMGLLAGERLHEWKGVGLSLMAFAFVMPTVHGIIGVLAGTLTGLSIGGSTMLGVLAMSSSFISAPVAMKAAIPEANPSLYLTSSVALTLPFSALLGIPICYEAAKILAKIIL